MCQAREGNKTGSLCSYRGYILIVRVVGKIENKQVNNK